MDLKVVEFGGCQVLVKFSNKNGRDNKMYVSLCCNLHEFIALSHRIYISIINVRSTTVLGNPSLKLCDKERTDANSR